MKQKVFAVLFYTFLGTPGSSPVAFEMLGESAEELKSRIAEIYNDEYLDGFSIDGVMYGWDDNLEMNPVKPN